MDLIESMALNSPLTSLEPKFEQILNARDSQDITPTWKPKA